MFDGITTKSGNGARRGSSMVVSIVLHGVIVALALVITYVHAKMPKEEAPVTVVFHAPPPPPPPPPAGHKKTTPHTEKKKPITPKIPNQIIQPKEQPKEEKPPEPAADDKDDDDDGVEGGVEGGVVGGVVAGVVGGVLGGTLGSSGEGDVHNLGAGMSRPQPNCSPAKPIAPEQARTMGITGMVLVGFTVHADGHVDDIVLKNPTAPPILFEAVKSWLTGCSYTPSMQEGKPIPVKMIVPFNFNGK